ncbi:MAG: hypothetical protein AB7F40_04955 [Victivallaceae bacterium]
MEKWTRKLLAVLLISAGYGVIFYMALLVVSGLDFTPDLIRPVYILKIVWPVSKIVAALLTLICNIFMVIWLQALWRQEKLAGGRSFTYLFWLILVPGLGILFCAILLTVIAWRRGWPAFILALFYDLLAVGATVPGIEHMANTKWYGLGYDSFWSRECSPVTQFKLLELMVIFSVLVVIALIILIPKLAELKWPKWQLRTAWTLLVLLLFSVGASYFLMYRVDTKVAGLKAELAKMGVPGNVEEWAKIYFGDESPNAEWSALVNAWMPDKNSRHKSLNKAVYAVVRDARPNEDALETFRATLDENLDDLCLLDNIFAVDGAEEKYAVDLNKQDSLGVILPQLEPLRNACRLYCSRIILAAHDRDAKEAMRLYRPSVFPAREHAARGVGSLRLCCHDQSHACRYAGRADTDR